MTTLANIKTATKPLLIGFASCCLALGSISHAATVKQVGLGEMIAASELVFHGTALESWTSQGDKIDDIFTHVRFRVHEVLKGSHSGDTIELVFLGGTFGRYRLDISDQVVPDLEEEGVYFIEQLSVPQVNPFYGWHQGRFIAAEDASIAAKAVRTSGNEPIFQVTPMPAPIGFNLSDGPANGVRIDRLGFEQALSFDAFKTQIRQFAGTN